MNAWIKSEISDFRLGQFLFMKIHCKESKPTDIHGVTCESKKLATSDFGLCDFEDWRYDVSKRMYNYGSFSLISTNLSNDVKCSRLVQAGFLKLLNL